MLFLIERMCGARGNPTQQLILIKAKDELEAWDIFNGAHDDGWGCCVVASFEEKEESGVLGSFEIYSE